MGCEARVICLIIIIYLCLCAVCLCCFRRGTHFEQNLSVPRRSVSRSGGGLVQGSWEVAILCDKAHLDNPDAIRAYDRMLRKTSIYKYAESYCRVSCICGVDIHCCCLLFVCFLVVFLVFFLVCV